MAPVRDHPLARGKFAHRANAFLTRAWERGWLPVPTLLPEDIWAIASRNADPGDEAGGRTPQEVADFRERLDRLCTAVREEADLNALGQAMAWGQLMRVVRNRLAFGALWRARPALMETPLAPPIIVVGHMRSGTTRIHKLLAADPAHSHTRFCDAFHPVPSRFGMSRLWSTVDLAMLGALNPWMQSIHPMAPADVEEELAWISAALHHAIYESQWHIPSYSAWSEARCEKGGEEGGATPIYREMARILRTDAGHRGNGAHPRVMKTPAFAEDLPALLAEFPDARIVVATRDLDAVHRSAVSLCANQMAVQSDTSDLARIEALWWHKIALREERLAAALADWRGPVARLCFDALSADWESAMERCYADLGLELSQPARAAMQAQMAGSAAGHHLAHSQQLQRFAALR